MISPADRVAQARQDIARRRELAQAAEPGPWKVREDGEVCTVRKYGDPPYDDHAAITQDGEGILPSVDPENAAYIASADPTFLLAVLDAAESVLDRHRPSELRKVQVPRGPGFVGWDTYPACTLCLDGNADDMAEPVPWPCFEAEAVLNVYAPEDPS